MILDSLMLTNIRSHCDTAIRFPTGITIFSGDIGSGKSTILMGIEFALFGNGSIKGESLLSKGADSGEIMLAFHVGDTKYEVGRTLRRVRKKVTQDPKGSYLRANDVLEPLTTTQLNGRILDILGLNEPSRSNAKSRIYRYAVFTPQDEMKSILWDDDMRLETIRKIFHMEEYQTAIRNANSLRLRMRDEANRLQAKFENLDDKRSELADTEQNVRDITAEISAGSKAERDLGGLEKAARDEVSRYEDRMAEKGALEVKYAGIRSRLGGEEHMRAECRRRMEENRDRIDSVRAESDAIPRIPSPTGHTMGQISEEIARFEALNEEIVKIRADASSMAGRIDALRAKLQGRTDAGAVREEVDKCESELGARIRLLDDMRRAHEDTGTTRMAAAAEESKLNEDVASLQKLGAKCSLCGHTLTREHIVQQQQERREALAAARSKKCALDVKYNVESEQIRATEDDAGMIKDMLASLQAMMPDAKEHQRLSYELARLQANLKPLDAKNVVSPEPGFPTDHGRTQTPVEYLSALKDALAEYENNKRRAADIAGELERLEAANKSDRTEMEKSLERTRGLESELGEVSAALELYKGDGEAASAAKARFEEARKSLAGVREELAAKKANLDNANRNVSRLEADIAEAERLEERHRRYAAHMNWLSDFFAPTVSRIEKTVLLTLQQTFNESYRTWYAKLIDDPTKDSYIDEEFAPIVEQDGYVQSVGYLSGGEKTSVALSYRLALNHMVRMETRSLESSLLILDEPTDGLSRGQLGHVKELLDGLNSEQIILVSHDAEMASHADHVFEVEKSSGATTVRQEPEKCAV
ncbi:MAG: SMC family ATPase [Nitrosopumilaceae archaeon]|nr:SMC family ATPase [Nitrosopumilaceae archaeon]